MVMNGCLFKNVKLKFFDKNQDFFYKKYYIKNIK